MAETNFRDEPKLFIGGKWRDASNGTYPVVNPATETVVAQAPDASAEDARAAAAAARAALPAWSALGAEQRCALLRRAGEALLEKASWLVPLVIAETGATATVGSRMQVPVAAARFARYSRDPSPALQTPLAPQIAQTTPLAPGGVLGALVNRQPVGVVTCITSFNFPLTNMAGKVAPALAAGNTVVIKPAPQDPLAVVEMVRTFEEIGFPPGVVNLVNAAGPEPAAALVDSADVDMVSFTGSSAIGSRIAETGGRSMKRLLLELGGKGACLVLEDADVEAAITCIASTWSFHSGQICTAPTRAVVHERIFDQVRDGLAKVAASLSVGDPTDAKTVVGPLISALQRDRVEALIATAAREGGTVVCGGGRPGGLPTGFYVEPTLITGTNAMTVAREEVFGPVVTMIPISSADEAVAVANDSDYGLYDYVYSRDTGTAMEVAKRLRAGYVGINTAQPHDEAPFGGFKMSGVGRDRGDFGLHAYSEVQSIVWTA